MAAPTAQEIADELPDDNFVYHRYGEWVAGNPELNDWQHAPTMAEALAAIWFKLNKDLANERVTT